MEGDENKWGLVFARDGLPIDGPKLTHEFQAALTRAKLPVIRWHDLRHATASLLLASGVPMHLVSAILGHSGIGVTVDTYGHIDAAEMREAIEKMADQMATADRARA